MSAPLVEVLLSSYQGGEFVREQVASVLAQTHPRLRLVVRDDGSGEDTRAVLRELAADSRILLREGENLGLPDAFFRMVDESGDDADLWALCDQDDVWVPDKIARAVAALQDLDGPALYCARVHVVDERLAPLYPHELPLRAYLLQTHDTNGPRH